MRGGRAVAVLAGGAVFVASVWLGWADPRRSLDLLGGTSVTPATAFALVATLCWLGAALTAAAVAGRLLGEPVGPRRPLPLPWLVLLAGAIVLGFGVAHHSAAAYSVCCANAATAQQVQQHVR